MKTVLFACVHNAGRSQMAAAFFNSLADPALARGTSAGTEPAERVHPEVVAAMAELGFALGHAPLRKLTPELARGVHLLVTMGCGEACPAVPGLRVVDWLIEDPKGRDMDAVRRIRDEIRERVRDLVVSEGWGE
jgi:arsenate reductase